MDNIISLFKQTSFTHISSEHTKKSQSHKQSYPFIILDTGSPENIFAISPHVMRIDETTYIIDLSKTYTYWHSIGKHNTLNTISQVIELELSSNSLSIFCEHPFKGLILYTYFRERGAKGSYHTFLPFTDKIFKNVSWSYWCTASEQIHDCFEKYGLLKKERSNFKTTLSQFERFLKRLKIDKLSELEEAHFYEIQRRFKSFIGLLFRWTFPEKTTNKSLQVDVCNYKNNTSLLGFPWAPFTLFEPPTVNNNLEYPLSYWDNLEPLLVCDLETLSHAQALKAPNKVSALQWEITLYDMTKVETEISFRYPLSYENDKHHNFSILLSQFKNAFEKYQHTLKDKVKETDLENVPIVIAWKVTITGIVTLTEKTRSLFQELHEKEQQIADLENLQNKIEAEISIFKVNDIHIPALDYSPIEIDSLATAHSDTKSELEKESHRRFLLKPLFIYNQPICLNPKDIKYKRYLERTASPWWQTNDLYDCYRDYHICEKADGQIVWAYQDYKGQWYIHGLYS